MTNFNGFNSEEKQILKESYRLTKSTNIDILKKPPQNETNKIFTRFSC